MLSFSPEVMHFVSCGDACCLLVLWCCMLSFSPVVLHVVFQSCGDACCLLVLW